MKKAYKALSVLLIVFMLVTMCTNVFAADDKKSDKPAEESAFDIGLITSNKSLGDADTSMTDIGSVILTIVTNIGMILAIILIAVLGVKYMMGSTEEKAEYKKSLLPYIVGAILVFGASAIGKMVIGFGQSIIQ